MFLYLSLCQKASMSPSNFSKSIINWYHQYHRDLPWRNTQDPYLIWLSEIILQQTRVKQGLPYYQKFVESYPTVFEFAKADIQEVLRLWQGLGYYSRARNMHETARYISNELQGKFPDNYKQLLKLKGVGTYTAAAIASFAYGEEVAVLDGNVFRVLARYFGIATDIASSQGQKEFSALAQELLPAKQSAVYNQAMMEFGAMLCSPQKPNCMYCPLQGDCVAFAQNRVAELPVKIKKIKQKERFFNYILFINEEGEIALQHRQQKGIWQGLYEFYLLESEEPIEYEQLIGKLPIVVSESMVLEEAVQDFKHVLTHQIIQTRFWKVKILPNFEARKYFPQLSFYQIEEIKKLPKPILIHNYLDKHFF